MKLEYKISSTGWLCIRKEGSTRDWIPVVKLTEDQLEKIRQDTAYLLARVQAG